MPVSRLDVIYRKILITKFFTKGWGSAENLKKLFEFRKVISNREKCYKLVPENYPITIINQESRSDCTIIEGKFLSPFALHMPDLMCTEVKNAFFQLVLPIKWPKDGYKPICIHLAGTGDHFFWRRRNIMAKPLLKKGIGSLILENPYYGVRKPVDQVRSSLHYVSDIFVMGGCLVLECIALLNWCGKLGFSPLGVSGISMGGHMASLAATNWPEPLVLVPCLSWSTASSVFTEGVMSDSIDWDMLQNQYLTDPMYCDTLSKLCKIVDDPFACSILEENAFHLSIKQDIRLSYITPYDMMNITRLVSNCPAIDYKNGEAATKLFLLKEISIFNILKQTPPFGRGRKVSEIKKRNQEALWFMRGIMDECTHLRNFSVPYDTSLIIAVCARADGYVPRRGVSTLEEIWPGVTVRYVDAGHVGAYIWYRKLFRDSIVDAFEKAKKIVRPSPNNHLKL